MAQDEYKCEECGATFQGAAELERHNRSVHSRFTCDACGRTFDSLSELEAHTGVSHPEQESTWRT
jgi:DNA-directed RNA polymerase subunit RPC12/RpoP